MHAVDAIRAFWVWWTTARDRVLHAIEVEQAFSDELVEEISQHVDAIGDLDWELGAGETSRHAFFLSAKGDPQARLVTELWRSLAPAADETWSYYPARQPRRGVAIELDGVRVAPDELRVAFQVETARERVHGTYFHPAFAALGESADLALFLLLDGELGEDGVERWLGAIEGVTEPPDDARPLAELRDTVTELANQSTGERFALLEGKTEDGAPLFVLANLALKRIDHLLHTTHVAVDLAVIDQNASGLPTNVDAEQLNALEDDLQAALGEHAIYFGRETRPGHRIVHSYVPEDSPVQSIVERWATQHTDRAPQLMVSYDPTWDFAKRF